MPLRLAIVRIGPRAASGRRANKSEKRVDEFYEGWGLPGPDRLGPADARDTAALGPPQSGLCLVILRAAYLCLPGADDVVVHGSRQTRSAGNPVSLERIPANSPVPSYRRPLS